MSIVQVGTKRAVIYCRVSHDKQGGRSVEEQEIAGRAECERNGWEVVAVLVDNSIGGSRFATKTRESWLEVKQLLASGKVDILVSWASTRTQRDLEEYTVLRKLCEGNEVELAYEGRMFDMTDYRDRYSTGMDALNGEYQAAQTRHNVMRALEANMANGKPHGKRLFGYQRSYDSRTGVLLGQVIDEGEAAIIREAAARALAGESNAAIARDLNERAIPSPGGSVWTTNTVRRILTNPSYAARRFHHGVEVDAPVLWDAILDDATHTALTRRFADPARRSNRDRTDMVHVLTGIMRCGVPECPGRLAYNYEDGKGVYRCKVQRHLSRQAPAVEAYVIAEVLTRLEQPDLADRVLAEAENPVVGGLLEEARTLRQRLDEAVTAHNDGLLSPVMLQRVSDDLSPRIAEADQAARKAAETPDTSLLLDVAGDGARERYARLGISGQRDVIRAMVDITVLPGARARRVFDPALLRLSFRFDRR